MLNMFDLLASFSTPINITTDPASMLWMFPLLASIAIIYKATKMRVLFIKTFIIETVKVFLTLCGVMILAIIVLNLVVWLVNG